MSEFIFEPIKLNDTAPGGGRELRTFDDGGAFILTNVDLGRRRGVALATWYDGIWRRPAMVQGRRRPTRTRAMPCHKRNGLDDRMDHALAVALALGRQRLVDLSAGSGLVGKRVFGI
jgi:hypothetical protein